MVNDETKTTSLDATSSAAIRFKSLRSSLNHAYRDGIYDRPDTPLVVGGHDMIISASVVVGAMVMAALLILIKTSHYYFFALRAG